MLAVALLLFTAARGTGQGIEALKPVVEPSGPMPAHGSVRVTLAVRGPAPLIVTLPAPGSPGGPPALLASTAAGRWQLLGVPGDDGTVTPDGRTPDGTKLERWSRTFRLVPWGPPDELPKVEFVPVTVTAGGETRPAKWELEKPIEVRPAVDPKARPRLPTGIEKLPPPSAAPESRWGALVAVAVAAGLVVVVALFRRARRLPRPATPGGWAGAEVDRIAAAGIGGRQLADAVAAVLRGFVERRFGIPAPRMTTGELVVAGRAADWPADRLAEVEYLLERCDRAKFAGDEPDAESGRELLARARAWITRMKTPPE